MNLQYGQNGDGPLHCEIMLLQYLNNKYYQIYYDTEHDFLPETLIVNELTY